MNRDDTDVPFLRWMCLLCGSLAFRDLGSIPFTTTTTTTKSSHWARRRCCQRLYVDSTTADDTPCSTKRCRTSPSPPRRRLGQCLSQCLQSETTPETETTIASQFRCPPPTPHDPKRRTFLVACSTSSMCSMSAAIGAMTTVNAGMSQAAVMATSDSINATEAMIKMTQPSESQLVNTRKDEPSTTLRPSSRRRPYAATVEALLPATRVRQILAHSVQLAAQLRTDVTTPPTTSTTNGGRRDDASSKNSFVLEQLRGLFEKDNDVQRTALFSSAALTTKVLAIDDWVLLDRLSGRTVRSALNIYTTNLQSGDSYVLTASPALRKQLILSDAGLLDVKTVITADLDLRDLYRNAIQTAVEDVQAELYWSGVVVGGGGPPPSSSSSFQTTSTTDVEEVQRLLQQANDAMTAWCALIDETDVNEAQRTLQDLLAAL